MHPEKRRFQYHTQIDPDLRFWLLDMQWRETDPATLDAETIDRAKAGLVTYPSGEILCMFGAPPFLPHGVFFMQGPTYSDAGPAFDRRLIWNGAGGVEVSHGLSRSQGESPRNYSTEVRNLSDHPVWVTKFGAVSKGLLGFRQPTAYFSPTQFREWYRVPDPDGWIPPGGRACDPENYGSGRGLWAYFFENNQGENFIATAPLERRL